MPSNDLWKWLFGIFAAVAASLLLWGGSQLNKLPVIEYRLGRIEAQLERLEIHDREEQQDRLRERGNGTAFIPSSEITQ